MRSLNSEQTQLIRDTLPAFVGALIAWFVFVFIGETPIVRASGLALVIVGMTLALREMGAILATIGGLTLAFSTAFWSQTGGGDAGPSTILIAIVSAIVVIVALRFLDRQLYIAIGVGVVIFALLFWSQIGTPRSLRLTSLVTGWLLYLLVDMLLLTNPRPDSEPAPPKAHHIPGILLLFVIGVLNDPLLTLFAPAIFMSLFLSHTPISRIYWLLFLVGMVIGLYGIALNYTDFSPYLDFAVWRNGSRWIDLIDLITNQFTIIGIGISALGLARLSRWYPPLGIVTMIAYAFYMFFGLIYSGPNREVLLLPLFIIQIVWMTYAVLTISQWAFNTFPRFKTWVQIAIYGLYALLPLILLIQILQSAD